MNKNRQLIGRTAIIKSLSQRLSTPANVKHRSTLGEIVEAGTTIQKGGHLLWKHDSLRVRPAGMNYVQVHRALFEATHGPIPEKHFLLNTCGVNYCIAADCFMVSRYAHMSDHIRFTHDNRCEFRKIPKTCDAMSIEGVMCR